ncbi:MAG: hypothetical protein FWF44_02690, partial [Defluviitaleaceae bacterium]|nr:hypothetical protein [Defluviitaleaceae bacterium]
NFANRLFMIFIPLSDAYTKYFPLFIFMRLAWRVCALRGRLPIKATPVTKFLPISTYFFDKFSTIIAAYIDSIQ